MVCGFGYVFLPWSLGWSIYWLVAVAWFCMSGAWRISLGASRGVGQRGFFFFRFLFNEWGFALVHGMGFLDVSNGSTYQAANILFLEE